MTTTRTPIPRNKRLRITPEAVEAYKRAKQLYIASDVDEWGLRSDECRAASNDLQRILGLEDGWDPPVLDTIGLDNVPECFLAWSKYASNWPRAVELRKDLELLSQIMRPPISQDALIAYRRALALRNAHVTTIQFPRKVKYFVWEKVATFSLGSH